MAMGPTVKGAIMALERSGVAPLRPQADETELGAQRSRQVPPQFELTSPIGTLPLRALKRSRPKNQRIAEKN
jgi:hypothetical protein